MAASVDAAGSDTRAGANAIEIEEEMSHAAADVIFRTLFSLPIEDKIASQVFHQFRVYQRTQPILNAAAFVPLPGWMPRGHRAATRRSAAAIRALITRLTEDRMRAIAAGRAPDDLATKIKTTPDPETGQTFSAQEMVDQVAIFFLAGHETSASALGWALYLMARYPHWQERAASEAAVLCEEPQFSEMSKLPLIRDIFRETLRLYPPVPMMVREASRPERFRDRILKPGAQIVLSPWHLHRHTRLWDNPDGFDPTRWRSDAPKACPRGAYMPFSAGARVCSGAGFAMVEGPLLLAMLLRVFRFERMPDCDLMPVAYLTVRSRDGIRLRVTPRAGHVPSTGQAAHGQV